MTWDAVLFRAPQGVAIDDLPRDWRLPPIGTPEEVKVVFEEEFPGQRHVEGQSSVEGDTFWVLFNYNARNDAGKIESIGVQASPTPAAIAVLRHACEVLGVRMMDCQTGEFADFSQATVTSMDEYARWRERALRKEESP